MISFITVSREEKKVQELEANLRLVFGGAPWELLVADGTTEDLFSGYNKQATAAAGQYLAFTHDDVRFLCNYQCFEKPKEIMEKPFTGFVGVAGSTEMPKEGCWWKASQANCRGAVYHPTTDGSMFGLHLNTWPHMAAKFGQVVVVDGVLLMCHRRVFDKLGGFDGETYKGFHYYDMDTSLRAHLLGLQNYVAPIPLVHASHGRTNENWEENKQIFVERHKKVLPVKL